MGQDNLKVSRRQASLIGDYVTSLDDLSGHHVQMRRNLRAFWKKQKSPPSRGWLSTKHFQRAGDSVW